MKELFLIAALALPLNKDAEYYFLRQILQHQFPDYEIVFVNDQEELLNPDAEWTPLSIDNMRVWVIRQSS